MAVGGTLADWPTRSTPSKNIALACACQVAHVWITCGAPAGSCTCALAHTGAHLLPPQAAAAQISQLVPCLDLLINVAGVLHSEGGLAGPETALSRVTLANLETSFRTNASGPILVAKVASAQHAERDAAHTVRAACKKADMKEGCSLAFPPGPGMLLVPLRPAALMAPAGVCATPGGRGAAVRRQRREASGGCQPQRAGGQHRRQPAGGVVLLQV